MEHGVELLISAENRTLRVSLGVLCRLVDPLPHDISRVKRVSGRQAQRRNEKQNMPRDLSREGILRRTHSEQRYAYLLGDDPILSKDEQLSLDRLHWIASEQPFHLSLTVRRSM